MGALGYVISLRSPQIMLITERERKRVDILFRSAK